MRRILLVWAAVAMLLTPGRLASVVLAADPESAWIPVAPGMELRLFSIPRDTSEGTVAVLRLDPSRVELELGTALASGRSRTVEDWAAAHNFTAVINAGMYRMDERFLSTGFLRDKSVEVNTFFHPNYGALFLFQPKRPDLPPVRFVDRTADPHWRAHMDDYFGVMQNYRLFGPDRQNAWPATGKPHSQAALAVDAAGRVLLLHCRPRITTGQFAQILLELPLELAGAMYLEGGADAALFVQTPSGPRRFVGEYASDLAAASNEHFWPVPNVLGARPKPAPGAAHP
ncbi:hypothetical protein TDMWS_18570 [Thermodesulfomicrobium sp. WS]|uniref:phosphodiester glycosidase family protein n=1 Tax=Thermodesulfomicrobium sp. WS TaxID=3004129 RepID=UPI0024931421|nr:phosphodiester glycosidase family protein [Thermodesulfomicrobium sp. WS]BDV01772.1 hypothetical protein TDMWS_18570 [Thermodesulfomicrobium sp. WS]